MDSFGHGICAAACVSRRRILGAGAAGVAAVALAGCSSYGDETSPAPAGDATGDAAGSGGSSLAKVADVPVGGGLILADQKVVLTQPEAGTIKAFSATCTHQGCTVSAIESGKITCPCHGSAFNVADGSVANGPASRPLPAVNVTVTGEEITRA